MKTWVKCENTRGGAIYINLANAVYMAAGGEGTVVAFLGDRTPIEVKGTPADILKAPRLGQAG